MSFSLRILPPLRFPCSPTSSQRWRSASAVGAKVHLIKVAEPRRECCVCAREKLYRLHPKVSSVIRVRTSSTAADALPREDSASRCRARMRQERRRPATTTSGKKNFGIRPLQRPLSRGTPSSQARHAHESQTEDHLRAPRSGGGSFALGDPVSATPPLQLKHELAVLPLSKEES